MGVNREFGRAQAPVNTMKPSHLLRIRSLLDCSSSADLAFWRARLIAYYIFFHPDNVAVTESFETSQHARCIDLMPSFWGYLLSLRHAKTIQFLTTGDYR